MKPRWERRVRDFIDAYGLHDDERLPVNFAPLDPVFRMIEVDRDFPFAGFTKQTTNGFPTEEHPVEVWIRKARLDEMRMFYIHEVAHLVLEHVGSIPLRSMDEWFHTRQENEVTEAVAMILIPNELFWRYEMVNQIASAAHVLPWIVRAHPLAGVYR
jgi:hypothetical protein